MAIMAMAVPILPGKTENWKKFAKELQNARRNDYVESRRRLEVRERVWLQQTPKGDYAVLMLEGADPEKSFRAFGTMNDPFGQWFRQQVKEIHGMDLADAKSLGMPKMEIDSQ